MRKYLRSNRRRNSNRRRTYRRRNSKSNRRRTYRRRNLRGGDGEANEVQSINIIKFGETRSRCDKTMSSDFATDHDSFCSPYCCMTFGMNQLATYQANERQEPDPEQITNAIELFQLQDCLKTLVEKDTYNNPGRSADVVLYAGGHRLII